MTPNIEPEGFSQLNRQNQAAIVVLIKDVLLDWQKKGWHGEVKLQLAPGSIITQVDPKPALRVTIAK